MRTGSTDVTEHYPGADRERLLEFVERSPAAVTRRDRDAWCALFAEVYCIEDPVGSTPQKPAYPQDRGPLSRFFATFIEPNDIRFLPHRDYVEGMQVLRDIEIEIRMARSVLVRVPMFLLYELVEEHGELRISRLAAHWELLPMLGRLFRCGLGALPVLWSLTWRMLQNQGPRGLAGFMRAAHGPGAKGKERLSGIVHENEDARERMRLCSKIIAAGTTVSARVRSEAGEGVVLAHFSGPAVARLSFYGLRSSR